MCLPRTLEGDLFERGVFAVVVKDLEVRSSQVRVSPKSNECPHKRQNRDLGSTSTEVERRPCGHKPRNTWGPQKLEEARRALPLELSRERGVGPADP